jgi:hypothetical protein
MDTSETPGLFRWHQLCRWILQENILPENKQKSPSGFGGFCKTEKLFFPATTDKGITYW